MLTVELVYAEQCPNVADTRANLLCAFANAGLNPRWREWRADDVDAPEHVRCHGSPTILVNCRDVAPVVGDSTHSCRLYEQTDGGLHGVPSVELITAALELGRSTGAFASSGMGRLQLNFAMVPGIGSALLPKVACPACWPAYAGFMSSVGLGFLLDTTYLFPLTAAFLAIAVGALALRAQGRRGYKPFLVGLVAAAGVLIGKFAFGSNPAMYVGLVSLVGASLWNTWPRKQREGECPSCDVERSGINTEAHRREP